MQPEEVPCFCFLLGINLLLAFLKAVGVPTEEYSARMIFLAITFLPFLVLSVMIPQTNTGRHLRLPQTASSHAGPTQSHPRRFSITLTVLYVASNNCTPTGFLCTLTIVLILQRWQHFLFNWFKHFICWLADALRLVDVDYNIQLPLTTQPASPDDADLEANQQGDNDKTNIEAFLLSSGLR